MSLEAQFKALLSPELMDSVANVTIPVQLHRVDAAGKEQVDGTLKSLGPYPAYFTLYEVFLDLWNKKGRDPKFAPNLVFFGKPEAQVPQEGEGAEGGAAAPPIGYVPLAFLWLSIEKRETLSLVNPVSLMKGPTDPRFVDSAGGLKALAKDDRFRMTLNDVFMLEMGSPVPEFHIFLYTDLVLLIEGARPLSEKDVYGRLTPYFPALSPEALPPPTGFTSEELVRQAETTKGKLQQAAFLEEQVLALGEQLKIPRLDGVKLLRWIWTKRPAGWESPAVFFFGTEATGMRPYMRLFSLGSQKLTKVKVKGVLPIPDLPDPELLLSWTKDVNPDTKKEAVFLKLKLQPEEIQDELPIYGTMRIFADGTADLIVLPFKQKRLLDPYTDIQNAPDALQMAMADLPYSGIPSSLGHADVVFKLRLSRDDARLTPELVRNRLKALSSIFQEIPPFQDEQPFIALRFKGVSNFFQEDRVFAYLTQMMTRKLIHGKAESDSALQAEVAREFGVSEAEARAKIIEWATVRNEYKLAVPEMKDYVLGKNPGIDIAVFAQHPIYNFHLYRVQSFFDYQLIVTTLGVLFSAPEDRFRPVPRGEGAAAAAAAAVAPIAAPKSPQAEGDGLPAGELAPNAAGAEEEEQFAFLDEDEDLPEFMRAAMASGAGGAGGEGEAAAAAGGEEEGEGNAFVFPNNDDVPEFMRGALAPGGSSAAGGFPGSNPLVPPPPPPPPAAAQAAAREEPPSEEDLKAREAFEKPADMSKITLANYYIKRLKLADPTLFDYKSEKKGYVTHCAANESRHPIVLDQDEYNEMRRVYEGEDKKYNPHGDLQFVLYPEDPEPKKFQLKQPTEAENAAKTLEGAPYPSDENPEIITIVKYGSKAKRLHYFFCPRLFCVRDRIFVRQKDFIAQVDRQGRPKPKDSCPFCHGLGIEHEELAAKESKKLDPRKTVLKRRLRPASDSKRAIYVGFLKRDKHPDGLALPCCYADPYDGFDPADPEFVRLGLRPEGAAGGVAAPPQAAVIEPPAILPAPSAGAEEALLAIAEAGEVGEDAARPAAAPIAAPLGDYIPNYYRAIMGISTKYLVDERKVPLEIIPPTTEDDPKAGPQVGLLPQALDEFFAQQSKAETFSRKLKGKINRELVDGARGFLRIAADNTVGNRNLCLLSALAPYLQYKNSADEVLESFDVSPRQFLQLNGGNLVHEFFDKCVKKPQNDMRKFTSDHLTIPEIKHTNIPAIERLMNSYECFGAYLDDDEQRKDMRIFYQALSEPGVLGGKRGVLFLILEMTVEREAEQIIGGKPAIGTEVKLVKIRCPYYPMSRGQQAADISFIIHYTEIRREKSRKANVPDHLTYHNLGWEPLVYIQPTAVVGATARHVPTLRFQRALEKDWPPIVQRRVSEFFASCVTLNRGPFTSQSKIDPNALIPAEDLTNAIRLQVYGQIRDAHNHFVAVTYFLRGKGKTVEEKKKTAGLAAIPIADDGTISFERFIHFDWDDYTPAPADEIIKFYIQYIRSMFQQYRGYNMIQIGPVKQAPSAADAAGGAGAVEVVSAYIELKKSRDLGTVLGVRLQNGIVIPATDMIDQAGLLTWLEANVTNLPAVPGGRIKIVSTEVDELEWQMNGLIAYDLEFRQKAFASAEESFKQLQEGEAAEGAMGPRSAPEQAPDLSDPVKAMDILAYKYSDVKEELDDIYQHLRLTFANWLGTRGAGKEKRDAIKAIIGRSDLPLFEKRKRMDILLEGDVMRWMEPSDREEDEDAIGFLRKDCLMTPQDQCKGRCAWKEGEEEGCRIHTPTTYQAGGVALNIPRMLYLRLVDELIRFGSARQELFSRTVPRLTIRQKAERRGDQYVIVEGSPDWNSWWERLRNEWMMPEMEARKAFDEKFLPIPTNIRQEDTRVLPPVLRELFGAADLKTANLVWNATPTPDRPYMFLQSVMGAKTVEVDETALLRSSQVREISATSGAALLYLPEGTAMGRLVAKAPGSTDVIVLATIDGVPGWVSLKGSFNVKIPLASIPDALRRYGL